MRRSSARVVARHSMIHCLTCAPWRRTPVARDPRDAGADAGLVAPDRTRLRAIARPLLVALSVVPVVYPYLAENSAGPKTR